MGEKARKASRASPRSQGWQRMKNGQEVMESSEWKFYYRQIFFCRQTFCFLARPHYSAKFLCHPHRLKILCYLVSLQTLRCWHKARRSPCRGAEVPQMCRINALSALISPGEKLSKPAWKSLPPSTSFTASSTVIQRRWK